MGTLIRFVAAGILGILLLLIYSCKKEPLSSYDTATVGMVVCDDDSIALPVTIAAGDDCLLSAYTTTAGRLKFNLTDNNGKLIWQKQFGITSISKILWERDGTFTLLTNTKLINITKEGVVRNTISPFSNLGFNNI